MTRVVKIGGAALGDAGWLGDFARAVADAPGRLVVVHGGGPEISALSERLGVPVSWSNGRRVTPHEAMDVASMVLSGRLNKRIVRALLSGGVDAVGLAGEDAGLVRAELAEGGALGRVGAVASVRAELLAWLVDRGLVPVVSPVSLGPDGEAVNVNADEVATAVAVAVGASELLYVTDVAGVRDAGGVRAELSAGAAADLVATGVAQAGMALKLEAALSAVSAGVPGVRIGTFDIVTDAFAGTRIRREAEVAA